MFHGLRHSRRMRSGASSPEASSRHDTSSYAGISGPARTIVGVRRWILIAFLIGCGSRSPSAREVDEDDDEEFDESAFVEGEAPPPAPPVRRPEPAPLPLTTADPQEA